MKQLVSVLLGVGLTVSITSRVWAATPQLAGGKSVVLPQGTTVDGPYFAAGDTVELSGTVNGDAYVAGGQVIINGTVNGDLLVGGGQVTINGTVNQDARIAGGQLTISGTIKRNLTTVGGNVDITPQAKLSGDMVDGAGNVAINAPLPGNLISGAGNLAIAAPISGSVKAGGGQISLLSNGSIKGNLEYWSDRTLTVSPPATISGTVVQHAAQTAPYTQPINRQQAAQAWATFRTTTLLLGFVGSLIIGWLLLKFAPRFIEAAAVAIGVQPGWSFIIGLLVIVLVPAAALILVLTVIGAPLGFLLFIAYLLLWYFSKFAVSLWLGNIISKQFNLKTNEWSSFFLGLIIFYVLLFIPVLSAFVRMLALLFGTGALILAEQKMYQGVRSAKLV